MTHIRHLLTSEDPNEQYLFLCVLESLDPRLWAGTVPEHPAVLDGWEVERIMQSLDSLDGLIRSKVRFKIVPSDLVPTLHLPDFEDSSPSRCQHSRVVFLSHA